MKLKTSSGKTNLTGGKLHPAIVAEASAWFIEFRAGDVSGGARVRFIEWLRRSPEHIQAYLEISGVWAELPTSDLEGKIDIASLIARARAETDVIAISPGSLNAPDPQIPAAPRLQWQWRPGPVVLGAAALVLLASLIVRFWSGREDTGTYSTGIGEQRTIQLADGSAVELNALSSVEFDLTSHRRDVTLLEGQAFFRVAKDKQRPFVVRAGDAQVRAVGTEFDVYRKQAATVVTVVEGRVETYDESGGASAAAIVLSAGEQVTVAPHIVTKPTRTDTSVATAWVQKHLIFEETPLSEVAEEFNRYSRRPLTISDPELQKIKISGVYSSTDPASLINFLRSQALIQVIETEKQVRVVRRDAH
jgi:transmembrane sensor